MCRHYLLVAGLVAVSALQTVSPIFAQSPAPLVVVPAANSAPVPASAPVAAVSSESRSAMDAALKTLQETKAANDEMIKKQEAALSALDELNKSAEQIKIYSKRG